MELKTFEDALKEAIKKYNHLKNIVAKHNKLYNKLYIETINKDDSEFSYEESEKEFNLYHKIYDIKDRYDRFFTNFLPQFVKNNKVKNEQLIKLIMVVLKYTQIHDCRIEDFNFGYEKALNSYFNESIMNNKNEILLKELAKMRYYEYCHKSHIDPLFIKYNIKYLEDFIIAKNDMNDITSFAIDNKNNPKLDLCKFENKILKDGSFENLYNYLYYVEKCNQKAVLTKILDIATTEELKKFSRGEADKKAIEALEEVIKKMPIDKDSGGCFYGDYYEIC